VLQHFSRGLFARVRHLAQPSRSIFDESDTVCRVSPTRNAPGTSGSMDFPQAAATSRANSSTVVPCSPPTLKAWSSQLAFSRANTLAAATSFTCT
jgi:hypothetical protein